MQPFRSTLEKIVAQARRLIRTGHDVSCYDYIGGMPWRWLPTIINGAMPT